MDGLNSKYYTCSEHQGFLELFKTAPGYDVVASSVVNGFRWSGRGISMDTCSPKQRISELLPRRLELLLDNEAAESRRTLPATSSQMSVASEGLSSMQVTVRIRPESETLASHTCILAASNQTVAVVPPEGSQGYKLGCRGKTYEYSKVFASDTTQEAYFADTAGPLVQNILQGIEKSCVIMTYGTSSAGKTHTIEGSRTDPGVLPRALSMLFKDKRAIDNVDLVTVARYEVYNERIYDLLHEGIPPLEGWKPLELKEDAHGCVFVEGLCKVKVQDADQAIEVLRRSSKQRRKATTGLNYSSSRSHSVFVVSLYWQNGAESCVSFVDLAGSERVKNTGNVGERLGESKSINSSLMTLRYCLENLRWNQKNSHVKPRQLPYRQSKITHLFRDALHGWGPILFCVNVSPAAADYDATACVLQYAAMATQIGNAARTVAPKRVVKGSKAFCAAQQRQCAADMQQLLQKDCEPAASACQQDSDAWKLKELASLNEELEDSRLELIHKNNVLKEELGKAHEKMALVETETREAISSEMEELMRDMEVNYKDRLAAEMSRLEPRFVTQQAGPHQPVNSGGMETSCGVAAHDFTHDVEEEELQDCCLDLTNRLEAAEKREAELASELAECQQNAERLEADLELQTATFSRIKSCSAAEIAQLTERVASLTQPTADAAKKEKETHEMDAALEDWVSGSDDNSQRRERQQDPYQPICQERERMVAELAASSLSRLQSVYQAYTCIDSLHLRVAWKLTCMLGQASQRESNLNARIRDMQEKMEETEAEQQATIQAQCQLQEELNVLRAEYLAREQQFQVNAAAEREMLESQLGRTAKDKVLLQQRLYVALDCTPGEETRSKGCWQAPTPHFVALARAQQKVGASKAPRSDKWLRQALAASQRDSPAPSPAIQWTGTPDTVQALCGKSSSISSLLSRATQTEEIGDAAKAASMISLPTRESGKRCASAMELASLHTLAPGEGAQADQKKITRERDTPSETQKRVSLDQTNELCTSDLPEMSIGSGGRSPGTAGQAVGPLLQNFRGIRAGESTQSNIPNIQPGQCKAKPSPHEKKKHGQTVEERKQGRKRKQLLAPTPMKIRVALEQVDPDIVADTGLAQQTVHASAGRRAGWEKRSRGDHWVQEDAGAPKTLQCTPPIAMRTRTRADMQLN